MKEVYEQLRQELSAEFEGRFETLEKEINHDLGGIISTLRGLVNLHIMSGQKLENKDEILMQFLKSDIRRKIIQAKLDSVQAIIKNEQLNDKKI